MAMMSNGPSEAADRIQKYPAALSLAMDLCSKRLPLRLQFTPFSSTAQVRVLFAELEPGLFDAAKTPALR